MKNKKLLDLDELMNKMEYDQKTKIWSISDFQLNHLYTINLDDFVKHGEWGTFSDRPDRLICSVCNCGFDMWKHDRHNYCPSCGAKMDGGKE